MKKSLKNFLILLIASFTLVFLFLLTSRTDFLFSRNIANVVFSKCFISVFMFLIMLKPTFRLIEDNYKNFYLNWMRVFSPKLNIKKINTIINVIFIWVFIYLLYYVTTGWWPNIFKELRILIATYLILITSFLKNFVIFNESGFSAWNFIFVVLVPISIPYLGILALSLVSINTSFLLRMYYNKNKKLTVKQNYNYRLLKTRIKSKNNFKKLAFKIWNLSVSLSVKSNFSERLRAQKNERFPGFLSLNY